MISAVRNALALPFYGVAFLCLGAGSLLLALGRMIGAADRSFVSSVEAGARNAEFVAEDEVRPV